MFLVGPLHGLPWGRSARFRPLLQMISAQPALDHATVSRKYGHARPVAKATLVPVMNGDVVDAVVAVRVREAGFLWMVGVGQRFFRDRLEFRRRIVVW